MSILNIYLYGSPVLREAARPVESFDDDLRAFVRDMADTMYAARGIGLAANQVGATRRVFVADVDQVDEDAPREKGRRKTVPERRRVQVFVNPVIVESSVEDEPYTEGCLSIPNVEGEVFRPSKVKLRYQDLDGKSQEVLATGLLARVIQHELDHLNGVMFVDHLTGEGRRTLAGELGRIRRIAEENPKGVPGDRTRESV